MYHSGASLDTVAVQGSPGLMVPMGRTELEADPSVTVLAIHAFEAVSGNSSAQRQPNANEKLVSTSVFIAAS